MSAILKALQNRKVEVELKSEVVEFGVVQDVEKLNTQLKGDVKKMLQLQDSAEKARTEAFSTIRKAYDKAKKAQDSLTGKFAQYENASLEAEILFNSAKKAAKELGVDFNDVKGIKDLQKTVTYYDNQVDEVKTDVTGILYNIPNI